METMFWDVDHYSSGPSFDGWAELEHSPFLIQTPDYPPTLGLPPPDLAFADGLAPGGAHQHARRPRGLA